MTLFRKLRPRDLGRECRTSRSTRMPRTPNAVPQLRLHFRWQIQIKILKRSADRHVCSEGAIVTEVPKDIGRET